MALADGLKELYRSRPEKNKQEEIVIQVIWEVAHSDLDEGSDGWVGVTGDLPDYGDTLSTCGLTGFDWTGFSEPRVEEIDLDPRYRAGYGLLKATFIGARLWADGGES